MKIPMMLAFAALMALDLGAAPIARVGAINWYATIPSTTFIGKCVARSLGPEMFRDRTPYFAKLVATNKVEFPFRTVEEYETELRYAIDAGIDYFAYCWYEESHPAAVATGEGDLVGMTHARDLHLKSALRDKLHLCAVLTRESYPDAFMKELAATMKLPCYEKVRGRPLLYLFANKWTKALEQALTACRAAKVPEPYVAVMAPRRNSELDYSSVQAISTYAAMTATGKTYESQFAVAMRDNDQRLKSGLEVIPGFSVGWDPTPRVLNPVPWCVYSKGPYPAPATAEQLLAGARKLRQWVAAHPKECPTGHVIAFAWNEFEEGGWICPNLGPDGKPDFARRDAFAAAVRELKCADVAEKYPLAR